VSTIDNADETKQDLAPPDDNPTAPVVDLTGFGVELVPPPDMLVTAMGRTEAEIEVGGFSVTLCFGAAALLMCWPKDKTWPAKLRPRPWRPGQDLTDYGYRVWEDLRTATRDRCDRIALQDICIEAHNWAFASGRTDLDIKRARDFTKRQEAERLKKLSTSAENTDEAPTGGGDSQASGVH